MITIIRGGIVGHADSIEEAELQWRRRMKAVLGHVGDLVTFNEIAPHTGGNSVEFINRVAVLMATYKLYSEIPKVLCAANEE